METGKTLLTGGVPAVATPNLPDLLRRQRVLENEVGRLTSELDDERHDAGLNIDGAADRAEHLAAALAARQDELASVRAASDQLRAQHSVEQAAASEARRRDDLRALAGAAAGHVQIAERVQAAGEAFNLALAELWASGVRIEALSRGFLPVNAVSSGTEAARLFRFGAVQERVRLAFFRAFNVPILKGGNHAPSFFPYDPPIKGEAALKKTLPERELDVLDAIPISVFLTFDEAVEARNRRDPSGKSLHLVQDRDLDLWRIVNDRARGQAAREEAPTAADRAA